MRQRLGSSASTQSGDWGGHWRSNWSGGWGVDWNVDLGSNSSGDWGSDWGGNKSDTWGSARSSDWSGVVDPCLNHRNALTTSWQHIASGWTALGRADQQR